MAVLETHTVSHAQKIFQFELIQNQQIPTGRPGRAKSPADRIRETVCPFFMHTREMKNGGRRESLAVQAGETGSSG
jgi:hypothetical protein